MILAVSLTMASPLFVGLTMTQVRRRCPQEAG